VLRARADVDVVGPLTTVDGADDRVAIHGVRRALLAAQAAAAGLPLVEVPLPRPCPNRAYETAMARALAAARTQGVDVVVFGDLFLEDVRRYREAMLDGTGLQPLFPLWARDTRRLAAEMLSAGVEAWITCVDTRQAPASLAGRRWDAALLATLPPAVDPCGERGEFHTFVAAGPMLAHPIGVYPGVTEARDGFVFADLEARAGES
jgi:diphthamide synthase (EF-2-diphthine--ammonia ligase)